MTVMATVPRWLFYSLISSLLCILGSLCVPLLSVLFKTKQHSNSKLVNYGLSLSAGSMITTSLFKMLPEMDNDNKYTVFFGFLGGICTSLFLNYVVHAFASESLIHCSHEHTDEIASSSDELDHNHQHTHTVIDNDATYNGQYVPGTNNTNATENQPLLSHKDLEDQTSHHHHQTSLIDLISNRNTDVIGDCCDKHLCTPLLKSETIPCVPTALHSSLSIKSTNSILNDNNIIPTTSNLTANSNTGVRCLENNIGYDLENLSLYRSKFMMDSGIKSLNHRSNSDTITDEDANSVHFFEPSPYRLTTDTSHGNTHRESVASNFHHHHLETPFSKLLSIGMQTCLVLTLHKFPEGFIIYYTNKSKYPSSLGLSIFLSLTIHNFVEGFAMTLPFYTAFKSKWIAILITTILGGGSQPLGALIGYLIFKNHTSPTGEEPHLDLLLSITAGFLLVIGLQMFQTGVGFSDGHHHHEGEDEEVIQQNHSSGTTCLKWCCTGAMLILASSLFT
ncbi:hypothetical protein NCAS_0B08360 [Naumovozyma castellii]|uniref:Zinc/iron permease n=1 Tax=Naumovozyma castellii TaxID=27288 RepID=G0VAP4_NAUCA|nr:hypothetical protein NCAS_0B08360 [Naumovozyma castellii CBS 4309]CCC68920.1 hypothetical protein NCAS_0B08360 [Naumovozyma castellii CBS 4309]